MEPNFQTSFIPKKPMIEERVSAPTSISFLLIIAIFIFFSVLLGSAGLYFYKGILNKNIIELDKSLNLDKVGSEETKIVQLQVFDKRLIAANEILSNHIVISPIFEILEKITMKSVRYTNFGYQVGMDGNIEVSMQGTGVGYKSIALQSDIFAEEESLIDPIFSNLTLDTSGNVLFDLDFSVDKKLVNYKEMLDKNESTETVSIEEEQMEEVIEIPN